MDQPTAMRMFAIIAKNRSFKAAAAEMSVAPSVVSKASVFFRKPLNYSINEENHAFC